MTPTPLIDLALAPLAGYLGTKAMEPVGTWLYERERGVVAHLAFGLAVAAVTEAAWTVLQRRP